MTDRQTGRFIVISQNFRTGAHQLYNWPSKSYDSCIAICQSMPPSKDGTQRLLLKIHDDDGSNANRIGIIPK